MPGVAAVTAERVGGQSRGSDTLKFSCGEAQAVLGARKGGGQLQCRPAVVLSACRPLSRYRSGTSEEGYRPPQRDNVQNPASGEWGWGIQVSIVYFLPPPGPSGTSLGHTLNRTGAHTEPDPH